MWGYGAYESCDDPWFDPGLVSLLDRGFVYALTSPRGGGENGRHWWLDGHLAAKSNTFTDHAAVANWLAGEGPYATGGTGSADHVPLVDRDRIVTRGLSAGGLLQAAALNAAPRRWRAVVAEVPFVDVIGSMCDPSIPLTVNEWEEWGDPRKPDEFAYMYAYSPYDNLPPSPRPRMLVTAALHDPRVLVHEPTKWVAKLRATASPGDELLFRVETRCRCAHRPGRTLCPRPLRGRGLRVRSFRNGPQRSAGFLTQPTVRAPDGVIGVAQRTRGVRRADTGPCGLCGVRVVAPARPASACLRPVR